MEWKGCERNGAEEEKGNEWGRGSEERRAVSPDFAVDVRRWSS